MTQDLGSIRYSICRFHLVKSCLQSTDISVTQSKIKLKPHFYILKLEFTGVYIIFLISAQNIDCGYSLEPPRWGGSNEYLQSMFWAEIRKKSEFFYLKIFIVLVVKFSMYLNRRVFVMRVSSFWCSRITDLVLIQKIKYHPTRGQVTWATLH